MSIEIIVEYISAIWGVVRYEGKKGIEITGFSSPNELSDNYMIWIKDKSNVNEVLVKKLGMTKDVLIICNNETKKYLSMFWDEKGNGNYLITEYPRDTFFSVLAHFFKIDSSAIIDWEHSTILTEKIGEDVSIGANCFIGSDVEIGNHVIIHNNVVIECPCRIGDYSNIYSGVVVGSNGFGYFNENGIKVQIPHFKGVYIGHHTDIGANACIDQGCLSDTIIGNYVKIDNLVHIAHNVQIADHCMIVAEAMIAGSSVIGTKTYIAPGARIIDHVQIGNNAIVGMAAAVRKDVRDNMVVVGVPAQELRENLNNSNFTHKI